MFIAILSLRRRRFISDEVYEEGERGDGRGDCEAGESCVDGCDNTVVLPVGIPTHWDSPGALQGSVRKGTWHTWRVESEAEVASFHWMIKTQRFLFRHGMISGRCSS